MPLPLRTDIFIRICLVSFDLDIEYLLAHEQKPDCFKEAARALRQGCRNLDQDEDEKTKCKPLIVAIVFLVANDTR